MNEKQSIRIAAEDMHLLFYSILLKNGFTEERASRCAEVFTSNSIDGVYTHGVNRFLVFIEYVKGGFIDKDAEPVLQSAFNGMEQWNGMQGAGPLNAIAATDRTMHLSEQYGIGCVALSNTNHWMRGGYYGWHAAKKGFVLVAWTNTIANMPAWGAADSKLGNNPLVIAVPYQDEAIVLDMAMSQYSFGAMEMAAAQNERLSVMGGYDKAGKLTDEASAIIESRRPLPIGYWKGAGMSLLLDILAAILTGGLATHQISAQGKEHKVSQVFIAIDIKKPGHHPLISKIVADIIADYCQSQPDGSGRRISFPGERVFKARKDNLANGIPVLKKVWEKIERLKP